MKSTPLSRFVCIGIPGLVFFLTSCSGLILRFINGYQPDRNNLFFVLFLGILGSVMLLIGLGKWKQPAYLIVFFLIPISFIFFLFSGLSIPPCLGFTYIVAQVAFVLVRVFYRRANRLN